MTRKRKENRFDQFETLKGGLKADATEKQLQANVETTQAKVEAVRKADIKENVNVFDAPGWKVTVEQQRFNQWYNSVFLNWKLYGNLMAAELTPLKTF